MRGTQAARRHANRLHSPREPATLAARTGVAAWQRDLEVEIPANLTSAGPRVLCNRRRVCPRKTRKGKPLFSAAFERAYAAFDREWTNRAG